MPLTSVLPSFVLVCPRIAARNLDADDAGHSFADVLARDGFLEVLGQVVLREYALIVRVSADLNPERCVPPSCVLMLLANEYTISA